MALATQTASFAQDPLELINIDTVGTYQKSGAAVLGLAGDAWNHTGANALISPLVDAQGIPTTGQFAGAGLGGIWTALGGTSAETRDLLADYAAFGPMDFAFAGMIPNTNYVLVTYMAGDNAQYGGIISWSPDGVTTNSAETFNNPLSTKASYAYGQNYVTLVVQSDANGSIGFDGGNTQLLRITGNSLQGWIPCWNGFQLQLAPDIPVTYGLPQPATVFPGRTARLVTKSAGLPPLSFQWQTNGVDMAGATNVALTAANVTSSTTYSLIVTNANGATTNSAMVSVVTPAAGSYPYSANEADPIAYWRMNESVGSGQVADYINGWNGTVGSGVTLGGAGVPNPPFTGFEAANAGAQFVANDANSTITVPAINLNANTATLTAWIKPTGTQNPGTAILLTRTGTGGAGLNYGPAANTLGYTWNNGAASTYQWNSGLTVPQNVWSFVALVIEPSKATLYVFNTGGISASINAIGHSVEAWGGSALIGSDSADQTGATNFNGVIDEVAVFSRSLSSSELFDLYSTAVGPTPIPPSVVVHPTAKTVSKGAIAQFSTVAVGSGTLSYQWQKDQTNLTDNARISGSATATLRISDVEPSDAGNYRVIVTGDVAPAATSSAASLAISATPLLFNVDFNADGSPTKSGAAVLGQAGNLWNGMNSASASGLLDYSGAPSTLGITLTGAGFSNNQNGSTPTTDPLMQDYAFRFGSLGVAVSGLHTNAAYTVVAYSAGDNVGQGGTFSGGLSGETTADSREPLAAGVNYLQFANIIADETGALSFQIAGGPGVLNGLQIQRQNLAGLPPVISPLPSAVTNYSGFPLVLSVRVASETAVASYQWTKDGANVSNNGHISGANSTTLSFSPLSTNDSGNYTLEVINGTGPATSSTVSVTVLDGTYGIVWSPPVEITTAEETLLIPGEIVGAATFGGTARTVTLTNAGNRTVDFTADGSVAAITVGSGGTFGGAGFTGSGNSVFDQLMSSCNYDNAPKTITLYNLTPGTRYTLQFFGIDMRGCCFSRQSYLQDPVLPSDVSATWQMGDGVYVLGTFTAADTIQTFIQQMPGTPTGQNLNNGMATAVVVRLAPPAPPTVSIANNHNGTVTVTWDPPTAHLWTTTDLSGIPHWDDLGTGGSITLPVDDAQFFRAELQP